MSNDSSIQLQGWLARLNQGDAEARAELIRRSCNRLQKLVRHMLRDFNRVRRFQDTDDVLQNVVVRLMRRLEVAKPPTVPDYFRLAAAEARHELIDLTRHYFGPRGAGKRETPEGVDASAESSVNVNDPSADSSIDPKRLLNWTEFHRQVEKLPDDERDAFSLLWYNDLSQAEAAIVLEVSVPTIKRRWLAARLRLQQWLDGDDMEM